MAKSGELVRFTSTANLPVTTVSVREDYPENYLLKKELGGGRYLEMHDRPHFHMPPDSTCGEFLIVSKKGEDGIKRVSAFKIPFEHAIHMGPSTIHSDAHIIGRHLVIHSATPELSTVILKNQKNN